MLAIRLCLTLHHPRLRFPFLALKGTSHEGNYPDYVYDFTSGIWMHVSCVVVADRAAALPACPTHRLRNALVKDRLMEFTWHHQ